MQNKTFAMSCPEDFLNKLIWENSQLKGIGIANELPFTYQVVNCAITAWHMADWAFAFLSKSQRERFLTKPYSLKIFREHLQKVSPALAICREIADAAKHQKLDINPNPNIETGNLTFRKDLIGEEQRFWFIDDGDRLHDPRTIIDEALMFWVRFLTDEGLIFEPNR